MSEQTVNFPVKYQQLLRDLKSTVEGLLVGQVASIGFVYGGLNRLHNAMEKIFKHGCKAISDDSSSDYWQFIQGLEWLQPSNTTSTVSIDCEYKPYIPQHLKSDRASIWLYRSLETHSLSQKLSWLLSDQAHLASCYQTQAFLCQKKYAESVLICLRAVERNQPSLLSEIDPCLFLSKSSEKHYHKTHRRCWSFPDHHYKELINQTVRSRTLHKLELSCKEVKASLENKKEISRERRVQGKLKPWHSMPELNIDALEVRRRCKSATHSHTTPSTPVHPRYTPEKKDDLLLRYSFLAKSRKKPTVKKVKRVVINNIIEHTPLYQSCNDGALLSDEFANLSIKSLPETKSSCPKDNLANSAPDYGFLSALSGVKDFKKKPKKTFIEDGGMSVLPMATGYFPRPTKGQTLTAFLTSSQFTRTNAELDRENAHFNISEAVISAIEQIRCKRDLKLADEQAEESDEEIMDLKQRIRMRRRQKLEEKQRKTSCLLSDGKTDTTTTEASGSPYSTSAGSTSGSISSDEVEDIEIDEASNLADHRGISMSMASLYSEADLFKRPRGAPDGASDILSAEGVALSLISRFNEKQLPRASDLEWLVSEEDAPQALLPLPKSWPVSPDDPDESQLTPLRGTREWAPPRPQIIFTPHPKPERKLLMAKQNYRCAGCGMRVAPQYASRFRYCDYLGRYFCTGCHTNQLAIIPGRVLQKWDFSRYPVSNFSYRLLEQMNVDPLFRIFELNKNITKRSKNLEICRRYRLGLYYLKDFVMSCRFAETTRECLENESSYLLTDPDVYSMQDLINVRSGEMKSRLKYLVEMCCRHTSECHLCVARGFICEICMTNEVIFPWQLKRVTRCYRCGSCYHAACINLKETACCKCQRKDRRKNVD